MLYKGTNKFSLGAHQIGDEMRHASVYGNILKRIIISFKNEANIMSKFNDFLAQQLQDSETRKEYDALEPEFAFVQAMIDARKTAGLTQKQLSEKTGIAQADISKLESSNGNPSLRTLQRLARGMGMKVKVEFLPLNQ